MLLLLQVVSFSLNCSSLWMVRRLSSFKLLLAFLDFCCLLRSSTHLFSPSEPRVCLRPVVGSSLIVVSSSLLPFLFSFDIYRPGLCTHRFPLSELSVRLHPAVGSSSIVIPLSLLPFLSSSTSVIGQGCVRTFSRYLSLASAIIRPAVG